MTGQYNGNALALNAQFRLVKRFNMLHAWRLEPGMARLGLRATLVRSTPSNTSSERELQWPAEFVSGRRLHSSHESAWQLIATRVVGHVRRPFGLPEGTAWTPAEKKAGMRACIPAPLHY